jgi:hypothetical protein
MDWPSSGDATVAWAINPDAFGWDTSLLGNGVYQPFRLNGAYFEDGTHAAKNFSTTHRPALLTQGGAVHDPQTETFLQQIGHWPNEPYAMTPHASATRWDVEAPNKTCGDPLKDPLVKRLAARVLQSPVDSASRLDVASDRMALNYDPSTGGGGVCYGACDCATTCNFGFDCCWCPKVSWGEGFRKCYTDPFSLTCISLDPVTCALGRPFPGSGRIF